MKIRLKSAAGVVKECKVGFSWTMLFFGMFVPLFRGDFKWTLLYLVISTFTMGLGVIILPFVYNKIYIRDLLDSGYAPSNASDREVLVHRGIVA